MKWSSFWIFICLVQVSHFVACRTCVAQKSFSSFSLFDSSMRRLVSQVWRGDSPSHMTSHTTSLRTEVNFILSLLLALVLNDLTIKKWQHVIMDSWRTFTRGFSLQWHGYQSSNHEIATCFAFIKIVLETFRTFPLLIQLLAKSLNIEDIITSNFQCIQMTKLDIQQTVNPHMCNV